MTISVVRHGVGSYSGATNASVSATWSGGGTADVGNALLFIAECEQVVPGKSIVTPAGWTELHRLDNHIVIGRKVSDGTETGITITFEDFLGNPVSDNNASVAIVEVSGTYDSGAFDDAFSGNPHTVPSVTPPSGVEALLVILDYDIPAHGVTSGPSGYTALDAARGDGVIDTWSKHVATTSGSYSSSISYGGAVTHVIGHIALVALSTAPTAEFSYSADETTAFFFDESTSSPTSWLWDFGDGNTSTSQNPTHIYASGGFYNVTLTATNAFGSDDVTHTVAVSDIPTDLDVGPGKATVEIYVHDPSGYRWDEANWDEATWSSSGWVDVTPESIDAQITWGVTDASRGILSIPDAATWAISFLDPERTLDPSNTDSPFFGDIIPFLPVRINHDGHTIRQGVAESIGFQWDEVQSAFHRGYMRVTDNIARMANADVPHDTTLSDTLRARAVDALEAAGLTDINVLPLADDPDLEPWADPTDDQSVWDWIVDASRQVLYQPYIDRQNQLGFRPYSSPLIRARSVDDSELVDLQVITDYAYNYSVIRVLDSGGPSVVERALTPTPAYGKRVYEDRADKPTPNANDWAQAVLEDRSLSSLRWIPGEAYPQSPERTRSLATVEAVEVVNLRNNSTVPIVSADILVLGGTIRLQARTNANAQWWITYEAAQTAELPLADSVSDPIEFLEATGGGQFLYPSV